MRPNCHPGLPKPNIEALNQKMNAQGTKYETVFGPEGIDQFTQGIEMAYAHDYVFRNEHHGDAIAPLQFAGFDTRVIDLNNPVIFDNGELKITAFRVIHEPVELALGFKFEYKGRSIVISGDTSYTQTVIDNSMNADVLFHEAQANHMLTIMEQCSRCSKSSTKIQKESECGVHTWLMGPRRYAFTSC